MHCTNIEPPKKKKRNVKKPVKLQECVLLPRGAFPRPPVKMAPTSKKLGALKICKQNFKTEAAPPAPINVQQNNYDSLPNSDVITVLKQTLQSLGSLKQEVQMLKEGKERIPLKDRHSAVSEKKWYFCCILLICFHAHNQVYFTMLLKTMFTPEQAVPDPPVRHAPQLTFLSISITTHIWN